MLGVAVAGAAVAAVAAGYQSMAPTGQWYGRTFTGIARDSEKIALTYDDGPNDPHTLHLLEVLARYDVRATFFLIGRYVQQRPDYPPKYNCNGAPNQPRPADQSAHGSGPAAQFIGSPRHL